MLLGCLAQWDVQPDREPGPGGVLQSSPHIPPGQAGIWEIPEGLAQLGMADQRALASLTPSHPLLAKTPPLSL